MAKKRTYKKKEDAPKEVPVLKPVEAGAPGSFLGQASKLGVQRADEEVHKIEKMDTEFPYIPAVLMTRAEIKLYRFLLNNLDLIDRVTIFTKVRLADIIQVNDKITRDPVYFYKIASKHIDFLIVNKETLDVICALELDDYTHKTEDRQKRDFFVESALRAAGVPLERIGVKIDNIKKCDLSLLEERVYNAFAPACEKCGKKMVLRVNNWNGHKFYACIDNVKCRHTLNLWEVFGKK